ncbi:MAG: hypothetical protein ONB16_06830 [candidate division KSB1 bacterium]|nr:hypothetical protein [candidate division KSB1 bacterium]MDZ7340276.1 hypothetical protein [candidate division KSB1 bacterium]
MSDRWKRLPIFFLMVSLMLPKAIFAQPELDSRIKVAATIDRKEVPLNRTVLLTVSLEWTGDLKRYQIGELENPILENLEIVTTSAADRRLSEAGIAKAAKIYEFILKPKAIGMGYIEPVIVKYVDNETGDAHSLITGRLSVKVIDPVAEPGSRSTLVRYLLLLLLLLVVGAGLLYFWWRRRAARIQAAAEAVKIVPLEEEYLAKLRTTINLKASEDQLREGFWLLSRLVREYLSKKYQIPALESTSEKIVADLTALAVDEKLVSQTQEILNVSDVAKFAGTVGNRSELERIYTLVEMMWERNLRAPTAGDATTTN